MTLARTRLPRGAPLRRTSGPARTTEIRPVSAKRRREQSVRRKVMVAHFGEAPACAIRWDDRCHGGADAPHELRKAGQGGSRTDPANTVPACHPCNSAIEDHPREAHRRGFVIRQEDIGGPDAA